MRFTISVDGKEVELTYFLNRIIKAIEEYESKYQQILDIIMETEQ